MAMTSARSSLLTGVLAMVAGAVLAGCAGTTVAHVALDTAGITAPRLVGSVHTGPGASGISIHPAGTLALVANRVEGSVSNLP